MKQSIKFVTDEEKDVWFNQFLGALREVPPKVAAKAADACLKEFKLRDGRNGQ